MSVHSINKKIIVSFGEFYGLSYLLEFYKIRPSENIEKLSHLNIKCSNLRMHFNEQELEEIKPLIHLLISKNKKHLNDIIQEHHIRSLAAKTLMLRPRNKVHKQNFRKCQVGQTSKIKKYLKDISNLELDNNVLTCYLKRYHMYLKK